MGSGFALADVDIGTAVMVGAVAFITSIIGGVSGYGGGMILPPLLAPIVGVEAVVPVMAVGMMFNNASRVVAYWREIAWDRAWQIAVLGLPLSVVGAYGYTLLTGKWIGVMLGSFFILVVPLRRWLARREMVLGPGGLVVAGGIHGLLSGGITGAGLIQISALMAAGVLGSAVIGTDAAIATVVNVIKIGIFWSRGFLETDLVLAGLLIGGCVIPGAFCAKWIMARVPLRIHTGLMDGLIIVGGLSLIWRAVQP